MIIHAHAKVNLTLDVLYKRDDGYHELVSLMHTIALCDKLEAEKADDVRVEFDCTETIPQSNTVTRAVEAYRAAANCGGAHIFISKRIPSEAGLGGASADAAAALSAMQSLYGALSHDELLAAALSVGADVPFCLQGGAAIAKGIGEKLTPLKRLPLPLLVVRDTRGISTKELFSRLQLPTEHPATEEAIQAYISSDIALLGRCMSNALEHEACKLVPRISELKKRMLRCGALGACMSGSGSAIVGLFENASMLSSAEKAFSDCDFIYSDV